MKNFVAREIPELGQATLHDVYAKEKECKADLVDYALLDTMHETKDIRYGKPYKKRTLEPSMYDLLTGGYVIPVQDKQGQPQPQHQDMTEEELKELQDAIRRKEIAKSKWMTETRDNFRKFTDSPNRDTYYIGNQLYLPNKVANVYEGHYMTTYKRDFGDEDGEEQEDGEDVEVQPVEEVKAVKPKDKQTGVKSPIRELKLSSKSPSRERIPKKKRK